MDSAAKKQLVNQFMDFTSTSESTANKYLKACNYKVDEAINNYFQAHPSKAQTSKANGGKRENGENNLESIFSKYMDKEQDKITIDTVEDYCTEIGILPTDTVFLPLCYHLNATTMGEFTKAQFIDGWTKLNCFQIEDMKEQIKLFQNELENMDTFKPIYKFVFTFFLNPGSRTLNNETACALWSILLVNKFPNLDLWLDFCANHHKLAINKDVWNLMLSFGSTIKEDLSNYDSNDAWPIIFDNFVEFAKPKLQKS